MFGTIQVFDLLYLCYNDSTDRTISTPSTPTPKTYFNDARRGASKNARIDAAIERLRSLPGPAKVNPKPTNVPRTVNNRPVQYSQPVAYNLASPEDFLSRMGLASATRNANAPSSKENEIPAVPAKQNVSHPSTCAEKEIQQRDQVKKSPLLVTLPVKESSNTAAPMVPKICLAGSKWALPSQVVPSAPMRLSPQLSESVGPTALNISTEIEISTILKLKTDVKVTKDNGPVQFGSVRLVESQTGLRFEIKIGDVIVSEKLSDSVTFVASSSNLTFRAAVGSPTYVITFQLPYEPKGFQDTWLLRTKNTSHSCQDQRGLAPKSHGTTSMENRTSHSRPLDTPTTAHANSENDSVAPPQSALEQFCPTNRISSKLFQDLSTIDGGERLISFDDEEVQPNKPEEQLPSALQDLLEYCDEDLVDGAFSHLNNSPEGSFLDQIARIVGGPMSDAALDSDLLSSPRMLSAAGELVGAFLTHSDIFQCLPDVFVVKFIKDKSRKVLEKAVAQRDAAQSTKLIEATHSLQVTEASSTTRAEEVNENAEAAGSTTNFALRTIYTVQELLNIRQQWSMADLKHFPKEESFPWKPCHQPTQHSRSSSTAKARANPVKIVNMKSSGVPITSREQTPRRMSQIPPPKAPIWKPLGLSQVGQNSEPRVQEHLPRLLLKPGNQAAPAASQEHDPTLWNLFLSTIMDNKPAPTWPSDSMETVTLEESKLPSSRDFVKDGAVTVKQGQSYALTAGPQLKDEKPQLSRGR
jgi:hypothetical protein